MPNIQNEISKETEDTLLNKNETSSSYIRSCEIAYEFQQHALYYKLSNVIAKDTKNKEKDLEESNIVDPQYLK